MTSLAEVSTGLTSSQLEIVIRRLRPSDGRRGRPWALPLRQRVLVACMALRTNLTVREIGAVFTIPKSQAHRILADVTRRLAALLHSTADRDLSWSWVVDGTLVPTRDHSAAAKSKNYRWSCNAQILVRRVDLRVIAMAAGPGNRNDPVHYRGSEVETMYRHHRRVLADGGYRGVPELITPVFRSNRIVRDRAWRRNRKRRARVEHAIARLKDWRMLRDHSRRARHVLETLEQSRSCTIFESNYGTSRSLHRAAGIPGLGRVAATSDHGEKPSMRSYCWARLVSNGECYNRAVTADPTAVVGTMIAERYQVVRVIGRGSNGAVCEVLDRSTGLPAALKILIGEDADLAARLEREGKALAMLAHPNIVALVDSGRNADGTPYVATELIRGVSLRDLLDAGAIAPRRALAIARQLLEALDHAHGAGMIHRDIKPENIMLADGGQPDRDYVKLLDFGIAKSIDPTNEALGNEKLTRAGFEVLGSPPYIAPETAIGEAIDARTDLYSVGIVLFEMLAGTVPFQDDDRTTLLRKHVTDPVPPLRVAAPDGTSTRDLEAVVSRALAKVPDHRFPSAMAMHAAVESVAAEVATAPSRRSWRARRARHMAHELVAIARRQPRRCAAIAAAVAVVLLIVVIANRRSAVAVERPPPAPVATSEPNPPTTARHWVEQAESEIARRRYGRAIAAFERALAGDRTLARDAKLRSAVSQIAGGGDAVAAVIALEVLATRLDPPDQRTIVEQASTGRLPEVRRRAFAIAERDGFEQSIDRFASWTLDLKQQATCEERRETITKLRDLGDPRAVDTLQRARAQYACVAKDAAAAITHLQSAK